MYVEGRDSLIWRDLNKKLNLFKTGYMVNTLEEEMQNYFKQLNETEKRSVILMLKNFLTGRKENTNYISVEQYNYELNEAEAEYERGEYFTQEEMLKRIKGWQDKHSR